MWRHALLAGLLALPAGAACPPIQGCIDDAIAADSIAQLPPGTHNVATTLTVAGQSGLIVRGHGAPAVVGAGNPGTELIWTGAATGTMWDVGGCRECEFSDFSMTMQTDTTGWHVYSKTGAPSHANTWRNIFLLNGDYGWRFTDAESAGANFNMRWEDVKISNFDVAGISVEHASATGMLLDHVILLGSVAPNDVGFTSVAGGVRARHLLGGNVAVAFADMEPGVGLTLDGGNWEGVGRLLTTVESTTPAPILVRNTRFANEGIHADGAWMKFTVPGPIVVENVHVTGSAGISSYILLDEPGTQDVSAHIAGYVNLTTHPSGVRIDPDGASAFNAAAGQNIGSWGVVELQGVYLDAGAGWSLFAP